MEEKEWMELHIRWCKFCRQDLIDAGLAGYDDEPDDN